MNEKQVFRLTDVGVLEIINIYKIIGYRLYIYACYESHA